MMMKSDDQTLHLQQQVIDAIAQKQQLLIHGSNSKHFYGNEVSIDRTLDVSAHRGIISYEPTELVVTVRAGTPISELETLLAEHQQKLPFEPPIYSPNSTIGGAIAAGLAGPSRIFSGSVRDNILGVRIINGEGKILQFGGQVIKNVAGYDISRLMVGSLGSLGVLLDVSIKVIPQPVKNITLTIETDTKKAITLFNRWRPTPLPISASCYYDDCLYVRLSGGHQSIAEYRQQIDGDVLNDADEFWSAIRNQTHEFFNDADKPLWRLSVPPSTPGISQLDASTMIEWNGAQRWIRSNMPPQIIRNIATKHKGHATLFRGDLPGVNAFMPQPEALIRLQQNIKKSLDPCNVFGNGRLYRDF
jgi:glycolate oxidase FAD binding subunit